MPAPRRKVPLLVRLRGVLLALAVLLALGLIGLYYFGRAGLDRPSTVAGPDVLAPDEERITTLSKGFDYTQYEDEDPVFRVRGETYRADRDGLAYLEQVDIELFRRGEESFRARSERATYDQGAASAELEGAVELTGGGGLKVWSEKLRVGEGGERVVSPVPTRFEYQQSIEGEADRMRVEIPAELFLLQGDLEIRSLPGAAVPMKLTANRGFLEQGQRLLRAEGKVRLVHGDDWLECVRLSAYLAEEDDVLRFVRAKWQVHGVFTAGAPGEEAPSRVEYSAGGLAALFDRAGERLQTLDLEGGTGQPADLRSVDPATGNLRRLAANFVNGSFTAAGLDRLQALGQVRLTEYSGARASGELVREARAERAEGRVGAGGALAQVELDGDVDYHEAAARITSNRADVDLDAGSAEFVGGPVHVVGERGEMKAPRVRFERAANRVHAVEGVRALLTSARGEGVPGPILNGGDGPIFVDSQEASWLRDEDVFVFSGAVRAWRERDLLIADEVRIDRTEDALEASGEVKTVWHPENRRDSEQDTLEVDADAFSYDGSGGRLSYRGAVRVDDGLRLMRCLEVDVELDDANQMRRLDCRGKARIEDRAEGRVVEGERAVYDPATEIVEVFGDPVTMMNREGSELKGRVLIYRLLEGTVEFRAPRPESDAGSAGR